MSTNFVPINIQSAICIFVQLLFFVNICRLKLTFLFKNVNNNTFLLTIQENLKNRNIIEIVFIVTIFCTVDIHEIEK